MNEYERKSVRSVLLVGSAIRLIGTTLRWPWWLGRAEWVFVHVVFQGCNCGFLSRHAAPHLLERTYRGLILIVTTISIKLKVSGWPLRLINWVCRWTGNSGNRVSNFSRVVCSWFCRSVYYLVRGFASLIRCDGWFYIYTLICRSWIICHGLWSW